MSSSTSSSPLTDAGRAPLSIKFSPPMHRALGTCALGAPQGADPAWALRPAPEDAALQLLAEEQCWEWLSAPFPELELRGQCWEVLAVSAAEGAPEGGAPLTALHTVARLLRAGGALHVAAPVPDPARAPAPDTVSQHTIQMWPEAQPPESLEAEGAPVPQSALTLEVEAALPNWFSRFTWMPSYTN